MPKKKNKLIVTDVPSENQPVQQKSEQLQLTLIPIQEYDKVLQENHRLQIQLGNLTGKNEQLEKILMDKEKTIVELKRENEILQERIRQLEMKVAKQDTHIQKQSIQITELTKNVRILMIRKEVSGLIIALKDLNQNDLLEKVFPQPYKQGLINLRNRRLQECHYIDDNDSQQLKECKRAVLLSHLENLSIEVKKQLNILSQCVDFVDYIQKYLHSNLSKGQFSVDEYEYARECLNCVM